MSSPVPSAPWLVTVFDELDFIDDEEKDVCDLVATMDVVEDFCTLELDFEEDCSDCDCCTTCCPDMVKKWNESVK